MFQRILQWIKEFVNKMIGQSNVKQALKVDIAISAVMANALSLWSQMYENKAPWLSDDIKSLNLPAAIAGEIARSVTIEMAVEISGSARADYLTSQFKNVLTRLREKIEVGCAKGGLMMKPYIDGNQVTVDFVQADQFYPVSFDTNGNITACVFADQRTISDKYYTRLEYHAMTESGCEIRNMAFRSDSRDTLGNQVPLATVEAWKDLQTEAVITGVDKPLFAYFRYPLANNVDPNSPLGMSCYSRAVDLIQDADRLWSNLVWEFESGKRALYVDVSAFDVDKNGKPIIPDKRLYRFLNGMSPAQIGEEGFYEAWSPEFREASIKSGLDAILKRIEYTCGLAYGTLSDPASVEKTATEIAASKQRTYATVTDGQKALQSALEQLIWAMDTWATLGNISPRGTYATAYDFDDSIIVDSEAQFTQDMRTVTMTAMPKYVFLMRNYGMTEEAAKKMVADAQSEQPQDMFQNQGA